MWSTIEMFRKLSAVFFFAMMLALAGCDKKSGEAIVLEKEHIAAREMSDATPTNGPEPSPTVIERALAPDEIAVGAHIMKAADRGTSRDPRALEHEQWIARVRMISGGRQFNVYLDQARWEKLKEGERVNVSYKQGKYTGTVWDADIR
jgi:hypothetical protein